MKMEGMEKMVHFQDQKLTVAYTQYLVLKDALVASDEPAAKEAAKALQKALKEVKQGKKASDEAAALAAAGSIAAQRQAFVGLSNEMTQLVKAAGVSSGELYLEYCPMANNNTGAYWLSNEQEIKNPYFGAMMLKCGKVAETIN